MDDERENAQYAASVHQASTYPFLNHSSITLPNNLPPNVDDKLLARHKRKRTSPEDQAILEAAYSRDPKPDKAARLELVKQVALGEKEVQIWFQNRRQTSRRKSRPLLPHEIAQYQLSRSSSSFHQASSDLFSEAGYGEIPPEAEPCMTSEICAVAPNSRDPAAEGVFETTSGFRPYDAPSSNLARSSQDSTQSDSSLVHSAATLQSFASSNSDAAATRMLVEPTGTVDYLASRKSDPSVRVNRSADSSTSAFQQVLNAGSRLPLKKSSSVVRLSLNYEGNAQITTTDGSSPSPPRASQALQVSTGGFSDNREIESAPNSAQCNPSFKSMRKSFSGRSRDSRAWEFWCDKDARSELEDKAEKDASGSAADAIDLLRSTSGRKVLGPLPLKRNSFLSRQSSSLKRNRLNTKSSLLQRSSTSLGRLQGQPFDGMSTLAKPTQKPQHSGDVVLTYIPSNDSDKENWSPTSAEQSQDSTSHNSSEANRRLSEDIDVGNHQIHRALSTSKSRTSFSNRENNDPEADPELAAFMRGEGKSNSISKEEELDCVQNLLSLSQGNWR